MQTERIKTILSDSFHVDVSRDQPFIIQTSGSLEVPLALLSQSDLRRLQKKARDQYVRSVLYESDSVDQHRATLFFMYGYENRLRQERQAYESTRSNRTRQTHAVRIQSTIYGRSAA